MIEAILHFLANLFCVILGIIGVCIFAYACIRHCEKRDLSRRDAIDRKKKLSGTNFQKLKP